jgi:hypothetical protein
LLFTSRKLKGDHNSSPVIIQLYSSTVSNFYLYSLSIELGKVLEEYQPAFSELQKNAVFTAEGSSSYATP